MMKAASSLSSSDSVKKVALVDAMPLRRAALHALLDHWQPASTLVLVDVTGDGGIDAPLIEDCAMVILNMGARSLRDEDFADIRNVLLPLAAQTPVVIVSDHAGQDEIVWSLEMRFRGYLPTSTEPSIAMSALTFILNGGDFFPPFVLGPPRARQNGYRDPSPPAREIKVSLPHDDDGFRY